MIASVQQGLKEEGHEVSVVTLCRWFGLSRRTYYYKPRRKALVVKPESRQ